MLGNNNNQTPKTATRFAMAIICLGILLFTTSCKWIELFWTITLYSTDAVVEVVGAGQYTMWSGALTEEHPDTRTGRAWIYRTCDKDRYPPEDIDTVTIRRISGSAPLYVSQYDAIRMEGDEESERWSVDGVHTIEEKMTLMIQNGAMIVIDDTLPHRIRLAPNTSITYVPK